MKFTTPTVLLVLLTATSSQAFTVGSRRHAVVRARSTTAIQMVDDKVEALRAAAAKARADAERLREELGQSSPTAEKEPAIPKKSSEEVKAIVPALLAETDIEKQASGWKELKDSKSVQNFASANLRSFPVALNMLETRTGLTPEALGLDGEKDVDLDDFKYATLWVTGGCSVIGVAALAFLPPNVGATICYLVALIPILFLAIGSTAPVIIANAIAAIKGTDKGDDEDGATAQERICRHEAAHFCCGYWCGLPIAGYSTEQDVASVEFAVAGSQYNTEEVAALSVTALAGLVGEAKMWGRVLPGSGTADLLQLQTVFRQSSDFIGAAAQQDLTRWGALTATLLLKEKEAAYEKVVAAFARKAPLEECIAILEE